jgi:ADP-dependent NAD(P)H-hydrate dehydratase / NAD(P)H-hydrate epimerase
MKALTAAEMNQVDRLTTERFGVPGEQLMETAGRTVAEVFLEKYSYATSGQAGLVVVLCGKGNNGGDGFVVARHLKGKVAEVRVFLFAKPDELRGDAAKNYQRWRELGDVTLVQTEQDWQKALEDVSRAEVIIDALLGTGIRGGASGLIAQAIEDVNHISREATAPRPAWVVAVDTPSGLPSDVDAVTGPVLKAHHTVTFTAPKVGQLISPQAGCCGQLAVRSIGSPAVLIEEIGKETLRWAGADEFASLPLIRAAESHKGTFGHVLLLAGSVGKTGAAAMAGYSGLRAGAGLVTIATPEPALPLIAAAHEEYMTEPMPATSAGTFAISALHSGRFAEVLKGMTVLGIGPGIGQHPETQEFVHTIVTETDLPIVLDADGLNAFTDKGDLFRSKKTKSLVITPHPGEMARLLGSSIPEVQKDRVKSASEAAKSWKAVVVLKGFHTIIAAPDGRIFVNTTGNPALAKGGSGDVLTGLLGGLIGQFKTHELVRVVALGVYLHGLAADLLAQQLDASGVLAGEVAQAIPMARRKLLEDLQRRD